MQEEKECFPKVVAEFLVRIYFDVSNSYLDGAIKRAYRDMNRTMREFAKDKNKESENRRESLRSEWRECLFKQIEILLRKDMGSQNEFDLWHKETCERLRAITGDGLHSFTYGQAQKWVNMSLKYLYVMGDSRVSIIDPNYHVSRNYRYFHIPVDNYINEGFFKRSDGKIKIDDVWSKLDYAKYIDYQNQLREFCRGKIPMDVEFQMFNDALFPSNPSS